MKLCYHTIKEMRKSFYERITAISRTLLKAKNKFIAIITVAITVVPYSFNNNHHNNKEIKRRYL